MPGEQLVCILQAVEATNSSKPTKIPIPALQRVLQSLKKQGHLSFKDQVLKNTFPDEKGFSFLKLKGFINNNSESHEVSATKTLNNIESACWEMCKTKYPEKLDNASLKKLWKIANRLVDETSYPPRIPRDECLWFTSKLAATLGAESIMQSLTIQKDKLSFKELIDIVSRIYFKDLPRICIDFFHCWSVKEIISKGWVFKRIRKQANWTCWSKCWLILTPRKLIYRDEPEANPKSKVLGEFQITEETEVADMSDYQGVDHNYHYRFKLSNLPNTICELAVSTEGEKESWIQCLKSVVDARKEEMTPIQKLLKARRAKDSDSSKKADDELDNLFHGIIDRKNVDVRSDGTSVQQDRKTGKMSPSETKNHSSAEEFLQQEKQKLKAVFLKIDTDGNGILSRDEFAIFAKDLGLKMAKEESDLVFNTIDKDGSGCLSYDEFEDYFLKNVLGENETGKSVAALRSAFLQADRDGSGTVTFKEFTEYMWDCKSSARMSTLLQTLAHMNKGGTGEFSFEDFQEFCQKEGTLQQIVTQSAGGSDDNSFEKQFKSAFDEAESEDLAEFIQDRWTSFSSFKRQGSKGTIVMSGGDEMVADFVPGEYRLIDLACFSDLPPLIPKHTAIKSIVWQRSSEKGTSGKLIFPGDFNGKILTDLATNELLRYYNCSFADSHQEKISLLYRHGIQDFTYENEYLSEYVKATNGGCGIERHEFSHLDCPLDEDSGYVILGKIVNGNEFHVTAFRVPVRHTLYMPAGVIHSNDHLKGTWRTMLSDEADIDHVHLTRRNKDGQLENFGFEFE